MNIFLYLTHTQAKLLNWQFLHKNVEVDDNSFLDFWSLDLFLQFDLCVGQL
jgi:hypothetical protein